ncbi:MAG: pilus assembly protein [Caldilineaceae bacterium]|nr:pilus assembly protein [Caldilineaceae bacterium]MCB0141535.1 pilus assembly protein [Caldilineaceae bacterium]
MRNLLKSERGSSWVELALVLPFFLFMIIGVVDLGRGYTTYVALTNSAREGARWISTYPSDLSGAQTRILAEAARVHLGSADLAISLNPAQTSYNAGQSVTVSISYDFPLTFLSTVNFIPNSLPTSIPLQAQATMRVLYDN